MSSHSPSPDGLVQVVLAFNAALNARDLVQMMHYLTPDCVFENTYPPPDGTRYEGQVAVRRFWEEFFDASSQATISVEEIFALGDRCVMRWQYRWVDRQGQSGRLRGVDLYRLRAGQIAEKLSYVKG